MNISNEHFCALLKYVKAIEAPDALRDAGVINDEQMRFFTDLALEKLYSYVKNEILEESDGK